MCLLGAVLSQDLCCVACCCFSLHALRRQICQAYKATGLHAVCWRHTASWHVLRAAATSRTAIYCVRCVACLAWSGHSLQRCLSLS